MGDPAWVESSMQGNIGFRMTLAAVHLVLPLEVGQYVIRIAHGAPRLAGPSSGSGDRARRDCEQIAQGHLPQRGALKSADRFRASNYSARLAVIDPFPIVAA